MKIKLKCIGGSMLITLSFVFGIGIISSIAMMVFKDSLEHVALISGIAQALYLLFVIFVLKVRKVDVQDTYGLKFVPYKEFIPSHNF